MSLVIGVDFGTLSVRVSVFDHEAGRLGSGTASYPLKRKKEDPDFATQALFCIGQQRTLLVRSDRGSSHSAKVGFDGVTGIPQSVVIGMIAIEVRSTTQSRY